MAGFLEKPAHKKWPRSQKFRLLPQGIEAGQRYLEVIVAARATGGREAFDAARLAWAQGAALEPGDGVFLGELLRAEQTLPELAQAIESSGTTRDETHAAVDRLVSAGLLEPVPMSMPSDARRSY